DGLIENLGGAHTPAVGWAAGIERLAMLVGEPEQAGPTVAVVVEHDDASRIAVMALTAIRTAGLDAEMIATGSPRKRFDKGVKLGAKVMVLATMHNDLPLLSIRPTDHTEIEARVRAVTDTIFA